MEVRLANYTGPLDLLLRLIARNEMDIFDIPMAELTAQYLEEVASIPPEMEGLSEFLVLAATLLEIKSQMLLPRPPAIDELEQDDPREALVQRLLAYQMAQALAQQLSSLTPPGDRLRGAGEPSLAVEADAPPVLDGIAVQDLFAVFEEMMKRQNRRIDTVRAGYGEMPRDRFTVTAKIAHIQERLRGGRVRFLSLLEECRTRREMVVTFLALLEMIRRGILVAKQENDFGDITCEAA